MEKTILITGASSGIGKAAAFKFAAEGWNVIATMRSPERETELTGKKNILVTELEVTDEESIQAAVNLGLQQFGKIDAVINNAGYGQSGLFEAISQEKIKQQFEVNVFGVMNVIRVLLPYFRKQKSGMILNISSGAGKFTLPLISLYASSKFALEGFSEALSFELSALNIQVKIIEPGGTATNFNKISADEFAHDPGLGDYDNFFTAAGNLFDELRAQELTSKEAVADLIYTAATDGTDTLRYAIGNDGFRERMNARATMQDQDYIDYIKSGFRFYL
jgi:NAD(P)-dependent dehydrogenase (short-subunit alcohol dehydrogenase family)